MNIVDYVREEVERQGHSTLVLDGIERVGWMLNAWSYALERADSEPTTLDVINLGRMVERHKNLPGIRKCGVRVGDRICPDFREVPKMLDLLMDYTKPFPPPLDFYRQFELIHPFVDGNGRAGKILLNWIGHTLHAPVFPPDDFWGYPIRNP